MRGTMRVPAADMSALPVRQKVKAQVRVIRGRRQPAVRHKRSTMGYLMLKPIKET